MALTPAQEAQYALANGVSRSDLSPAAQVEYDRLVHDLQVAKGSGAPRHQGAAEEERWRAREAAKATARREATIDAMDFKWNYPTLKVLSGTVRSSGQSLMTGK
jgi:hypothetical protein